MCFMCFFVFAWFDCTNSPSSPYLAFTPLMCCVFFFRRKIWSSGVRCFTWTMFSKIKYSKKQLVKAPFFTGPLCKGDVCGNATLVDQVDEKLSQKEATKMKEPPCHLGGLYKAGKMLQIGPPLWILGNIHHPTNEKDVHVWFIWVVFRWFWVRYPKTRKYDRSCHGSPFPKIRFQSSCQISWRYRDKCQKRKSIELK